VTFLSYHSYTVRVVYMYPMSRAALPHPLPERLAELIARRFGVLAEPMRIKLIDQLREGEATVGELVASTRASQQNVSKHLGVLAGAGIVRRRREGTRVRYSIADEGVLDLCAEVCGTVRRSLAELDALLEGGG
jgi:DNA-binding transcriptional ArsR family regulator